MVVQEPTRKGSAPSVASCSSASASPHVPKGKGTAKPRSRGCTQDTVRLSWNCLNFPKLPPGQKKAAQPMPWLVSGSQVRCTESGWHWHDSPMLSCSCIHN